MPGILVFIAAGDQVPGILFKDLVGKTGAVLPSHKEATGLNNGIIVGGASLNYDCGIKCAIICIFYNYIVLSGIKIVEIFVVLKIKTAINTIRKRRCTF